MADLSYSAVGTASAVLSLSKAAWKLGSSLSRLDQDIKTVDATVKALAGDVKSLGNECDLLDEVVSKCETNPALPCDIDGGTWSCLGVQLEEASRTIQELELFLTSVREEDSVFMSQA